MRPLIVLGLGCGLAAAAAAAQQPSPTFRAGIDLLTFEASVVDVDGQPVAGLTADDFIVTVNGEPRRVVTARFLEAERGAGEAAADAPPVPAHAGNTSGMVGRTVVFVVDRDSISPGSERALLEAAGAVMDALGPADAVGLVGLPEGSVELTREHDRVRAALLRMTGTRPMNTMQPRDRNMSWEEALAFDRRDPRVVAEVIERECYRVKIGPIRCPEQLQEYSREILTTGRNQVTEVLSSLTSLVEQLARLRGAKQIVLLSGGMPFGQDLLPRYDAFTRTAAEAEVVLHAVHLDQFESDAANRKIVASPFGGREFGPGLGALSAGTGGAFYTAAGSGAGIFARIKSELRAYYQLGIETRPGDDVGNSKPITVAVRRPGATVRSGRRVMLPAAPPGAGPERLTSLLDQATDVADLPIAVATYTMRGDDASTLRVVLAAEVGAARSRAPVEWAFRVFSEGNAVATARQTIQGEGLGPWAGSISAKLLPGRYRLRIAAIDAEGRTGVSDVPLVVGLRGSGPLQFSDVMLGVATDDGRLQARSQVVRGTPLSGLVELMSADPAVLGRSRAVFEIAPAGSEEPIKRFLMAARSGAADTILVNQIEIETSGLPPGDYVGSVIPLVDNQPVGRVSRRFTITAP